jgi:hypothetical protein
MNAGIIDRPHFAVNPERLCSGPNLLFCQGLQTPTPISLSTLFQPRPRKTYGIRLSPSHRTFHFPLSGKPGVARSGQPSQPAAIIATAASKPPFPGK